MDDGCALMRLNKIFIAICSSWASINKEVNLPTKSWHLIVDRATLIWSGWILVACLIKCLNSQPMDQMAFSWQRQPQQQQQEQTSTEIGLKDLLILNYLPRMNEFGRLYFGLQTACIGSTLLWRVYLSFYRHKWSATRGAATTTKLSIDHQHKREMHCGMGTDCEEPFDPKFELVQFFINGPATAQTECRSGAQLDSTNTIKCSKPTVFPIEQCVNAQRCARAILERSRAAVRLLPQQTARCRNRRRHLLARVHDDNPQKEQQQQQQNSIDSNPIGQVCDCVVCGQWATVGNIENIPIQVYFIPINSADFFDDNSRARWLFLVRSVYSFCCFVFIVGGPLVYRLIIGLNAVRHLFGAPEREGGDTFGILAFRLYGIIEQTYACSQAAIFFVITNIFISLFHADLIYKSHPIRRDIARLCRIYQEGAQMEDRRGASVSSSHTDPQWQHQRYKQQQKELQQQQQMGSFLANRDNEVHRQQLRLWAYFENLFAIDDFISRYSVLSMATLIIGLSFGQSLLRVGDPHLKFATAAVLFGNFLSFTYLHLISWHIEQRSTSIHKAILMILAREQSHETKRQWQKTLFGFFDSNWKRTFTLAGRYPLNLHSYFKTIFGLATISLVINRLFHKRAWEASFAYQHQTGPQNAANPWGQAN